jgi:hypothetical protein
MARRRHSPIGTRGHVVWTAVWFVLIQAAGTAYFEARAPAVYDAEFAARLAVLDRAMSGDADPQLLLVVGSSRLSTDFRPEALSPHSAPDGRPVVAVNFSHSRAGPLLDLVELNRLLRRGIRPRWAVIEVVPAFLSMPMHTTVMNRATARDLPLLARYVPVRKLIARYLAERGPLTGQHRREYQRYLLPDWAGDLGTPPPLERQAETMNWLAVAGPEDLARRMEIVREQYQPTLAQLHIDATADQALREMIALFRRQETKVVLLVTPESTTFRGWYSAAGAQQIDDYLDRVSAELGVKVIDARPWMADAEFVDGHHLHPRAAAEFTRRLERDVLAPLVNRQ